MSINTKRLIENLISLIKIDSPTLYEKEVADYIQGYLENLGAKIYRDNIHSKFGGNCGNLVAYFKGNMEDSQPICYNAHLDTVTPGIGIKPQVLLSGEFMISSGDTILGADDKAGIAAIIEAYQTAKDSGKPTRDLYMWFTVCEEKGMYGVKYFDYSKLPCKEVVSVDAAGAPGVIAVGGRGRNAIIATFIGEKAHVVFEAGKGINAIKMASDAISNINFGQLDEQTITNVGMIEGGTAPNIVPERAIITMEVRSFNAQRIDEETEKIIAICEQSAKKFGGSVEISKDSSYPALKVDVNSKLYLKICDIYTKDGIKIVPTILGGAGDCNEMSQRGYDCAIIACGMYDVHTNNENLDMGQFIYTTELLVRLLTDRSKDSPAS